MQTVGPVRPVLRHCPTCNSERPGELCWKCGTLTEVCAPGWDYPKLPNIVRIRELARDCGYAIAVHGSQERDLDLIAVPWTTTALSTEVFLRYLEQGLNARVVGGYEIKPHGRFSLNLQINGWFKLIDLSIVPMLPLSATGVPSSLPTVPKVEHATKTRLKAFVREHTPGQCMLFSNPDCDCLLCAIDKL